MRFLYVTAKGQNCVSDFPLQPRAKNMQNPLWKKKKKKTQNFLI